MRGGSVVTEEGGGVVQHCHDAIDIRLAWDSRAFFWALPLPCPCDAVRTDGDRTEGHAGERSVCGRRARIPRVLPLTGGVAFDQGLELTKEGLRLCPPWGSSRASPAVGRE